MSGDSGYPRCIRWTPTMSTSLSTHMRISLRTALGTIATFCALGAALVACSDLSQPLRWIVLLPLILVQGLWLDRMYIVAHEGVHRKLFPDYPLLNEITAT